MGIVRKALSFLQADTARYHGYMRKEYHCLGSIKIFSKETYEDGDP